MAKSEQDDDDSKTSNDHHGSSVDIRFRKASAHLEVTDRVLEHFTQENLAGQLQRKIVDSASKVLAEGGTFEDLTKEQLFFIESQFAKRWWEKRRVRSVIFKALQDARMNRPQLQIGEGSDAISDESKDWGSLFWEYCRLVTSPEIQSIYADVLRQRFEHPEAVPKSVLRVLPYLDRKAAEVLRRIARFTLAAGDDVAFVVPYIDDQTEHLYELSEVGYEDVIALDGLGVIRRGKARVYIEPASSTDGTALCVSGLAPNSEPIEIVSVESREKMAQCRPFLPGYVVTPAGRIILAAVAGSPHFNGVLPELQDALGSILDMNRIAGDDLPRSISRIASMHVPLAAPDLNPSKPEGEQGEKDECQTSRLAIESLLKKAKEPARGLTERINLFRRAAAFTSENDKGTAFDILVKALELRPENRATLSDIEGLAHQMGCWALLAERLHMIVLQNEPSLLLEVRLLLSGIYTRRLRQNGPALGLWLSLLSQLDVGASVASVALVQIRSIIQGSKDAVLFSGYDSLVVQVESLRDLFSKNPKVIRHADDCLLSIYGSQSDFESYLSTMKRWVEERSEDRFAMTHLIHAAKKFQEPDMAIWGMSQAILHCDERQDRERMTLALAQFCRKHARFSDAVGPLEDGLATATSSYRLRLLIEAQWVYALLGDGHAAAGLILVEMATNMADDIMGMIEDFRYDAVDESKFLKLRARLAECASQGELDHHREAVQYLIDNGGDSMTLTSVMVNVVSREGGREVRELDIWKQAVLLRRGGDSELEARKLAELLAAHAEIHFVRGDSRAARECARRALFTDPNSTRAYDVAKKVGLGKTLVLENSE